MDGSVRGSSSPVRSSQATLAYGRDSSVGSLHTPSLRRQLVHSTGSHAQRSRTQRLTHRWLEGAVEGVAHAAQVVADAAHHTGSASGSFATETGGQDYGFDQIVGSDLVGSEYIFIRGNGNNGWENVLLIADQDNTEILVNGQPYATIAKAGDFRIIEGDNYSSNSAGANMYVRTLNLDHKLFAFQGTGSVYQSAFAAAANQGMFFDAGGPSSNSL
mgnify:CR=1 FL=1